MLRAAVIGAGYIGEFHARAYAGLPGVTLKTIVDPDLVSICTPTPSHAEIAEPLMRKGVHILCEKPLALTLEQAQSMIDTARQTGVKFMVAHVSRYEVDHLKARESLERGDIGSLRMAFHSITSPYPGWSAQNWLGDQARSGGPIVDLAIHSIDYLMWLFKSPVARVYAVGSQKSLGNCHYAQAMLFFANGGLGLVETSWAHPASAPLACRVELCGSHGRIAWDYNQTAGMQTYIQGEGPRLYVMEGENSYASEIADFIRCVQNNLPSPVPGSEAKAALQVCLAAQESLLTGRCVEINPL